MNLSRLCKKVSFRRHLKIADFYWGERCQKSNFLIILLFSVGFPALSEVFGIVREHFNLNDKLPCIHNFYLKLTACCNEIVCPNLELTSIQTDFYIKSRTERYCSSLLTLLKCINHL